MGVRMGLMATILAIAVTAPAADAKPSREDIQGAIMQQLQQAKTPADHQWENRLLIVGREGASELQRKRDGSRFSRVFDRRASGLAERKLIVFDDYAQRPEMRAVPAISLAVGADGVASLNMLQLSAFEHMRPAEGEGFQMILIGLDGEVKQRWDGPVSEEMVFAAIDAMPMRRSQVQTDAPAAE
jgi:hypothetical protein